MLRVARFLTSFARTEKRELAEEVRLRTPSGDGEALLVRPRSGGVVPGWIVLHGITVPGRHHPVLRRFVHALAASGAAVLVPDIPSWRRLRLDPTAADEAIRSSIEYLRSHPGIRPGPLNVLGFSFGGTHALVSASKSGIREHVGGVVAFGALCDLARSTRFMFTGEHEWRGSRGRLDPDPYGRWIIAGNYLRLVPEFSHMSALTDAALRIAAEAGRVGIYAADPIYDEMKARLRAELPTDERVLWDVIAPPSDRRPDISAAADLAERIERAVAASDDPIVDPRAHFEGLDQRIVLAHGMDDRLIPFTEGFRLREALPETVDSRLYITRLYAHSARGNLSYISYPTEIIRYLALLRNALAPC